MMTRLTLSAPGWSSAGESTLELGPLPSSIGVREFPFPFLPSINADAIFSDWSSWAVMECLSRRWRNEGRCRYTRISDMSKRRSMGMKHEGLPRSRWEELEKRYSEQGSALT